MQRVGQRPIGSETPHPLPTSEASATRFAVWRLCQFQRVSALHQRGSGIPDVTLALREGRTTLRTLHQVSLLRALFPTPEQDEPLTLVNTGGRLAGGDRLSIAIHAEAETRATISAPVAEKIYRSLGPPSRIDRTLHVGDGAMLEWIPQETILFDGARLQRRIAASRTRCHAARRRDPGLRPCRAGRGVRPRRAP
jgi:hypothetical protein